MSNLVLHDIMNYQLNLVFVFISTSTFGFGKAAFSFSKVYVLIWTIILFSSSFDTFFGVVGHIQKRIEQLESGQQATESHTVHIEDNIHQLQGEFLDVKQTSLPFLPFLTTKQKH